ncbi:hypothetical protein D3C72_2182250 [compost metagenome]
MGAARQVDHGRGAVALPEHQAGAGRVLVEPVALHQFVAAGEGLVGGAHEEVVHIVVGAGDLADATGVGTVDVDQRGIQLQRRHGDPVAVVGVG